MKRMRWVFAVLLGVGIALAGGGLAVLAVRKCWLLAEKFAGAEAGAILKQLETADVRLSAAVLAGFGAVIALAAEAMRGRKGLRAVCIVMLALVCPAVAFLTMKVNSIPMRIALEVLSDVLRAGLF